MHAYIHVTYPTNRMLKHSPSADAKKTTKRFLFFLRRNICWPPRPKGLDQNSFWLGQLGTQHDILRKMTGATWNQLGWKKMQKVDPIAGWVFRHSGRDMQICIQKRQYCTVPLDFWDPLILYIYTNHMSGSNWDKQNLYRVSSGTKPLLVFLFPINGIMRYPLHLQSQLQTWHFLAQTSRKDDVTADAITTSGRLRDVWKIVVQQVGPKQCRGCVFQGVLLPPFFPLALSRAHAWASKTIFWSSLTALHQSIPDSIFSNMMPGILFSSLSLVVPYSCFFCPLCGRCCCCCSAPSYCPLADFIGILPHPFACEFLDLQRQPHVRDKDAKVYADPPAPRIEEPVFVIQPIHLQPFGTQKKDLNLQVTILSFMYTNNLNILKKIAEPFHFSTFSTIFLFLLILLKKLRILRVILEALLIQGVHQVLDFLMDLIHHVVWRPWWILFFFWRGKMV